MYLILNVKESISQSALLLLNTGQVHKIKKRSMPKIIPIKGGIHPQL